MKLKRSEHNRFVQWLDRNAEKNPLLWLPCVLLIVLALAGEHIAEYAKIVYSHRNTAKVAKDRPQLEKKPFALRAVAVTLTAAFSLMLVPVTSFDAFGEEYGSAAEQTAFGEVSETEGTAASEETAAPKEITVPEETSVPAETTAPAETSIPKETTVPEETLLPEEEMFFNGEINLLANHTHQFHRWEQTEHEHWRVCTECSYETPKTPHRFESKFDTNQHWQECSVCGYRKDEEPHDLSDDWQTDEYNHWQGCTECDYATTKAKHNLHTGNDDSVHWQYCPECLWESERVPHSLLWQHDDFGEYGKHWQECACGYETVWEEHDFGGEYFDDWTLKFDEKAHWYECTDCGLRIDLEEHDYKWDFIDSEHWRICEECGKKADTGEHVYKWKHNDNEHWEECVCGKKLSAEEHKFADGVFTLDEDGETAVKRYYCTSYCGYYYDVPITHTHTHENEWKHDDSEHWYECTSCGKKVDAANHDYSVKVTIEPTETEKGTRVYTCKVCGYSYDEAIPELEHTHSFGTEWHKDGSNHWHECRCGEKSDIAAHFFDGETVTVRPTSTAEGVKSYTCNICGYEKTETIPALPPIQDNPAPVYYPPAAVTETPLRLPYITNNVDVKGWINIAAYINASPNEVTIPITMNGEDELPKEVSECIINRDVTLRINMGGGSVWTVNGLDVTEPKTVNLRVSERSNKIPSDVIDALVSEFEPKQYRLYHKGNLGFTSTLTLIAGKKYNNYYAALYHYNTKTKQLEFVDESLVENKQVTFELTHASYYAVAFSSIPIYDDVSSGAGIFESSLPIETSAMPETGGVTIPAVKLPQITRYSNPKRRYRILKKRRLDDLVFVL